MAIAPSPQFPERPGTQFERKMGNDAPGVDSQGPLYFEEGIATDTDVPTEFEKGIMQGYMTGARPTQNANVYEKYPEETMRERAHLGSAAWTEAPQLLGSFSEGAMTDYGRIEYQEVVRNGRRLERANPAVVKD